MNLFENVCAHANMQVFVLGQSHQVACLKVIGKLLRHDWSVIAKCSKMQSLAWIPMRIAVWSHCQMNESRFQTTKSKFKSWNSRAVWTCFFLQNAQDGPMFVCKTLRGKPLRPRMRILYMFFLTSTLLTEITYLTFDFASWRHFIQRDPTFEM